MLNSEEAKAAYAYLKERPVSPASSSKDSMYSDEKGKIFVGGLSWDTSHTSMLRYFSRYGEVIDCVVMKNQQTGKSRGFGFITYKDSCVVDRVLASGPHELDGRLIDPKSCNPRSLNKGGKNAENAKKKVFVGGLPANCSEADLKDFFGQYGNVQEVVIMFDQEKQRSRGFGFLTYDSEDSVEKLCNDHFVHINGKQVECKRAEPRDAKMDGTSSIPMNGTMASLLAAGHLTLPSATLMAHAQGSAAAGAVSPYATWSPQTPGVSLLTQVPPLLPLVVPGGYGAGSGCANVAYPPPWSQPAAAAPSGCDNSLALMHTSPTSSAPHIYTGPATPNTYRPETGYMWVNNGDLAHDGYAGAGLAAAGYGVPPSAVSPMLEQQAYGSGNASVILPASNSQTVASKPSLAYAATYTTHYGLMGSYPQEASAFGRARPYPADSHPPSANTAHISFTPNVTYSLAPGMTPIQGGYGALTSAFAGTAIPGAQGDIAQPMFIPTPAGYARVTSAHLSAFHPYRR